jgi:hypothetical protein
VDINNIYDIREAFEGFFKFYHHYKDYDKDDDKYILFEIFNKQQENRWWRW